MTIQVHKSGDRSYFDYEWLKTYHTFSFARHEDSAHRGFHSLKVLNENIVRPGTGFPVQSHQDMEIFSVVVEGRISHQDDLGNGSILSPGHIQLISVGKGMAHSIYNASDKEEAHFLQFWVIPVDRKLKPSYQEKFFLPSMMHNRFCLIISSDGRDGSLHIHQHVDVYMVVLDPGKELDFSLDPHRYGWMQVIKGEMEVNEIVLEKGDGASISEVSQLQFKAQQTTQFVFLVLS